jgi:UDP-glucuronate 4-epimerase
MTILITGYAGFIGSALCRKLIAGGERVIGVDSHNSVLYSSRLKNSNTNELIKFGPLFSSYIFDLSDIDCEFFKKHQVRSVINFAALPGQVSSWQRFDQYLKSNVFATQRLLEAIKCYGKVDKLIQVSTSSVYGAFANSKESSLLTPSSPYGVTKLAAENLIKCYCDILDVDYTILRYFSVYGPGQRPDMAISQFLKRIISNKSILATGDGTQARDLSYVDDVVAATISALKIETPQTVYDISGGESFTVNEIVNTCLKVTNSKLNVEYIERPIGDQEKTLGNRESAVQDLGLKRTVSLEEGVSNQFQHLLRKIKELGDYS